MQKVIFLGINMILLSFSNWCIASSVVLDASLTNTASDKNYLAKSSDYLMGARVLSADTDTGVRCYFYIDNKIIRLWGKVYDEMNKPQYAKIVGQWYSNYKIIYNVYYSRVGAKDLKESCRVAFITEDLDPSQFESSFIQYNAASNSYAYDYEFWLEDNVNLNLVNIPNVKAAQSNWVNSPIRRVVILGDSVSDTHNFFNKLQGIPKEKGWFHGRFSNGPVWTEYVAKYLGVDLQTFAEGAAEINPVGFDGFIATPFDAQYVYYKQILAAIPSDFNVKNDIENTLFVLFIGGNDFKNQSRPNRADLLASTYLEVMGKLLQDGAKYIMAPVFADMSDIPDIREIAQKKPEFILIVQNDIKLFNSSIEKGIVSFKSRYPSVKFLRPDFNLYLQAQKWRFAEYNKACNTAFYLFDPTQSQLCKSPLTYLFWDKMHPSAKGHCYLGYETNKYLSTELNLPPPKPVEDSCEINFIPIPVSNNLVQ